MQPLRILLRAEPIDHQHAPEIQPYGHVIRMPIALSEHSREEAVENLRERFAEPIGAGLREQRVHLGQALALADPGAMIAASIRLAIIFRIVKTSELILQDGSQTNTSKGWKGCYS